LHLDSLLISEVAQKGTLGDSDFVPAVSKHRYKIGQLIYFRPNIVGGIDPAPGPYQITRQLPGGEDGEFRYEIRSTLEEYDRVAKENELVRP
jgi:hypothetical protein